MRTYPTDLPEGLIEPITSLKEGKAWIALLVKEDLMFHFDDDPKEIVHGPSSEQTFTEEAAEILELRLEELYSFKWGKRHGCPLGYALFCENPNYDKE